ncbi:MAG: bacillithiol biosynthesis cysteine-adding enzyme BshC [Chitinophagaceae bacterium]|nr:MAG: bacillithiol biosynthesis cysteine-adding enzyme BshC [Chitinophagaceae bacterium]
MKFKPSDINFSDTNSFSNTLISYLAKEEIWKKFTSFNADFDGIRQASENTLSKYISRKILNEVLNAQYKSVNCPEKLQQNLEKLKSEKTLTITAAHQPVVLGGPLYVALKIIHAVKLADTLNEKSFGYTYVPVYVMGSEDHDFEEISGVDLYGKRVKWEREAEGPVGRLSLKGFEELRNQLSGIIEGSPEAEKVLGIFDKTHAESKTFGKFTFKWIHHFFAHLGLVILRPDNKSLKSLMVPIWEKEIKDSFSQKCVLKSLKNWPANHKIQAKPRDINLFYFENGKRQRLSREGKTSSIIEAVDDKIEKNEEEWLEVLREFPEKFSPNVFLRPLYQSTVLPDAVFIGGPSEIAYWLELKEIFDAANAGFPVLMPRASLLWIDKYRNNKLHKLKIDDLDLFRSTDKIVKSKILEKSANELNLNTEIEGLSQLYNEVLKKALQIDKNLEKSVESEKTKSINSFKNLESKIIRAEKRHNETLVNQVENIKEKLFPSGSLMERKEAFLSLYLQHGSDAWQVIYENIEPITKKFKIIRECEE